MRHTHWGFDALNVVSGTESSVFSRDASVFVSYGFALCTRVFITCIRTH
jgi:hypothetical protein